MQISKEKLSEYARLIVRTGANIQPGQVVQLSIAVEQHEFAAMITEEAYLAGAKKVSEDPDALAGLDPEKLSRVMQSRAAVAKPYRDEIDGRHQWCIAALPSEAWARKCFPGKSDEEAMELLYDAVFRTVRISDGGDGHTPR